MPHTKSSRKDRGAATIAESSLFVSKAEIWERKQKCRNINSDGEETQCSVQSMCWQGQCDILKASGLFTYSTSQWTHDILFLSSPTCSRVCAMVWTYFVCLYIHLFAANQIMPLLRRNCPIDLSTAPWVKVSTLLWPVHSSSHLLSTFQAHCTCVTASFRLQNTQRLLPAHT